MLKWLKRHTLIIIISITIVVIPAGCTSFKYNDGDNERWITEQVENGTLTPAEAETLRQTEK